MELESDKFISLREIAAKLPMYPDFVRVPPNVQVYNFKEECIANAYCINMHIPYSQIYLKVNKNQSYHFDFIYMYTKRSFCVGAYSDCENNLGYAHGMYGVLRDEQNTLMEDMKEYFIET